MNNKKVILSFIFFFLSIYNQALSQNTIDLESTNLVGLKSFGIRKPSKNRWNKDPQDIIINGKPASEVRRDYIELHNELAERYRGATIDVSRTYNKNTLETSSKDFLESTKKIYTESLQKNRQKDFCNIL